MDDSRITRRNRTKHVLQGLPPYSHEIDGEYIVCDICGGNMTAHECECNERHESPDAMMRAMQRFARMDEAEDSRAQLDMAHQELNRKDAEIAELRRALADIFDAVRWIPNKAANDDMLEKRVGDLREIKRVCLFALTQEEQYAPEGDA